MSSKRGRGRSIRRGNLPNNHVHSAGHHHDHGGHGAAANKKSEEQEEAEHYYNIVHAFATYGIYTQVWVSRTERQYNSLPAYQKALLPEVPAKIVQWRELVKKNMDFIKGMLVSEQIFQNKQFQLDLKDKKPSEMNIEKTYSTLKQMVREWSTLGQAERDQCFKPILNVLETRFPDPATRRHVSVLSPGSGLGRLPFEIARRGFASQGNEFSYFMLIAGNHILNRTQRAEEHSIFPFIHTVSNVVRQEDQFLEVRVPDVLPSQLPEDSNFSYAAGDFVEIYKEQRDSWDAICTCFFMDTANNIIDYVETIYATLKPGGVWINLGPLLYHYVEMPHEQSIELTLDQLLRVVKAVGFEIQENRMETCQYTKNHNSMMSTVYQCSFFVASKPLPVAPASAPLLPTVRPDPDNGVPATEREVGSPPSVPNESAQSTEAGAVT